MALVNPNIAMSFRQPEFQPRNALAEYAQVQQIMGGQRQAEMADMQIESLRRERDALGQIQAAIVAKGGPPDLEAAADAMIKTGRPEYLTQGMAIRTALRNQREAEAYRRDFSGGAAPAAAATPANAMVAPAAAAAPAPEGELVAAPIRPIPLPVTAPAAADAPAPAGETNLQYLQRQFGTPGGAAGPNALAPAAAPGTNAMAAPAAPTAAPDADATRLAALEARYNRIGNNPELASEKALLLKQIEAALRGDQNRPMAVSQGQVVIDPRTGRQIFSAPETTKLSDRFVPVGRLVFDRQTQQYISPTQAQLAQSQERAATAAAPGGKPPVGYRFTPGGDLEPIPGGPAARAAEPKPLTPAQEIKRRDTLGKEFKSATSALQTTQDVLDSISFVKSEPGLSRATGFTGMLPSFPEGAAASAETRLANLRGKITALGKAAAASTGAIGSIANQEWKILADQIAAIDPVKGKGPLLDQLALVETQAQGAMARIQDAYQRQFGEDFERFPQFSNLPSPKSSFTPRTPATAPNLSPQEQTELDQLRQRFKGR
jgi:hypothetical protein